MLTVDQVLSLHKLSCECDEKIKVHCPNCLMAEVVMSLSTQIESMRKTNGNMTKDLKSIRDSVTSMNNRHNVHIQALQTYYHLLHKDCPCLIQLEGVPQGKCGSPWITLVHKEVEKLTRKEEQQQITDFLAKKGSN